MPSLNSHTARSHFPPPIGGVGSSGKTNLPDRTDTGTSGKSGTHFHEVRAILFAATPYTPLLGIVINKYWRFTR